MRTPRVARTVTNWSRDSETDSTVRAIASLGRTARRTPFRCRFLFLVRFRLPIRYSIRVYRGGAGGGLGFGPSGGLACLSPSQTGQISTVHGRKNDLSSEAADQLLRLMRPVPLQRSQIQ